MPHCCLFFPWKFLFSILRYVSFFFFQAYLIGRIILSQATLRYSVLFNSCRSSIVDFNKEEKKGESTLHLLCLFESATWCGRIRTQGDFGAGNDRSWERMSSKIRFAWILKRYNLIFFSVFPVLKCASFGLSNSVFRWAILSKFVFSSLKKLRPSVDMEAIAFEIRVFAQRHLH